MTFEEKLTNQEYDRIWQEYCGFLDIDEFRAMVPLTTYEDYADVLLLKKEDMLPDKPIIWIQTTWEGGKHPIKVAPYTSGMLQTYKNNILTCLMMAASKGRGSFDIEIGDTFALYHGFDSTGIGGRAPHRVPSSGGRGREHDLFRAE